MNLYEELGLETIINASDTYTWLGGSRMSEKTLEAMRQAAQNFVSLEELSEAICTRIAERTGNEAAFISTGAGGNVVLLSSACMAMGDPELERRIPDASQCPRNEIVVFASQRDCPILPYWHLIELSGAKLVGVDDSLEALESAITEKTAAVFFFTGTVYEWTTPDVADVIAAAKKKGTRIVIDAAAQLPSKKLMWQYTVEMGADAVIFSGGKFISGPQTTGLALGRRDLLSKCKTLASPNVRIGRPYKVGKEEYCGIYAAVMDFLDQDEDAKFAELKRVLEKVQAGLIPSGRYHTWIENQGRLGQAIPMLYMQFDDGTQGADVHEYMLKAPNRIDIGKYEEGDPTGDRCRCFVNAINLREYEIPILIDKLNRWIERR